MVLVDTHDCVSIINYSTTKLINKYNLTDKEAYYQLICSNFYIVGKYKNENKLYIHDILNGSLLKIINIELKSTILYTLSNTNDIAENTLLAVTNGVTMHIYNINGNLLKVVFFDYDSFNTIIEIKFSNINNHILIYDDHNIKIWNINNLHNVVNYNTVKIISFVMMHDNLVLAGTQDGCIFIWNINNNDDVPIIIKNKHKFNG